MVASVDRLAGMDDFLKPAPAREIPSWKPSEPVRVAYAAPVKRQPAANAARKSKIWLQLASGPNSDALPVQFQKIKSKNRDLFDGIKGYIAKGPDRSRLLIGPFRDNEDAEIFAEGLESVNAFRWTNSETDTIVPIGTN